MKRLSILAMLVGLTGCSNAPIAGFLDCVSPSKARPGTGGDRPMAGGEWAPNVPDGRVPAPPGGLPPPVDVRP